MDSDTQSKRILIWQELLIEMPPAHRKLIEANPKGPLFENYCAVVAKRLAEWQKKREH